MSDNLDKLISEYISNSNHPDNSSKESRFNSLHNAINVKIEQQHLATSSELKDRINLLGTRVVVLEESFKNIEKSTQETKEFVSKRVNIYFAITTAVIALVTLYITIITK